MPLEPLLPLFHRLNREHFAGALVRDGRPLVQVRWSDGRLTRTAGYYRRGVAAAERAAAERTTAERAAAAEIVLSRPLLEPLPRAALLSTLAHEMIHAWIDQVLRLREVHGPRFRDRMAAINGAQQEFVVSVRHCFPVPAAPARWLARCPRCAVTVPYQRRRQGLACRSCCERWHGGRWDPSCLLVFEPVAP